MNAEMKTVVVTGASGDIGLAISNRLIADGFFVAACSHNHHDRVASAFTDMQNIALFDLNLREESSIKACATAIIKARGPIAGLVNCAGVATGSLFAMTRLADMRDLFEVNLFGPLLFTQYIVKKMVRQKYGAIINLTSTAGILADPGTMAYGGSKVALGHASRVMASELGPLGIRVNAVAPSVVSSSMAKQMDSAARAELKDREALVGKTIPADVADTISYLISDRAAAISGQIIRIDRAMPF